MGLFERYLTVWVGLGIVGGVGLGLWVPGLFQAVAALEFAHVNLVVAVFIWVMIYPMMIQIDFASIRGVGQRPRGLMLHPDHQRKTCTSRARAPRRPLC